MYIEKNEDKKYSCKILRFRNDLVAPMFHKCFARDFEFKTFPVCPT